MFVEGAVGCADCGVSAKVESITKHIHPKTGRQVHALDVVDRWTLAIGLFITMAFIDGIAFAAFPGIVDASGGAAIGIAFVLLTFILPLALSLAMTRKVNKTFSQALEVTVYHCTHCGKEW